MVAWAVYVVWAGLSVGAWLFGLTPDEVPTTSLAESEHLTDDVQVALTAASPSAVLSFEVVVGGDILAVELGQMWVEAPDGTTPIEPLATPECEVDNCIGRFEAHLSMPAGSGEAFVFQSVNPRVRGATSRPFFAGLADIQLDGGAGFHVGESTVDDEVTQRIAVRSYQPGLSGGDLVLYAVKGSLLLDSLGHEPIVEGDSVELAVPDGCEGGPCFVEFALAAVPTTSSRSAEWALVDRRAANRLEVSVENVTTLIVEDDRSLEWTPNVVTNAFTIRMSGLAGISHPIELQVALQPGPSTRDGGPTVEVFVGDESRGVISPDRPPLHFELALPAAGVVELPLELVPTEPWSGSYQQLVTVRARLFGAEPSGRLEIEAVS
jgi:hypothetical protein